MLSLLLTLAAGQSPEFPPTWSWPDLQRTSYTVIIEKCPQPCPNTPLVGRGYMYVDYTEDKSSPKIYPKWFFQDVYDAGTLDSFAPQMYDLVIGRDGNYTYQAVIAGHAFCGKTPYPWDRFPQMLTLKKGTQPMSTGFPLPEKTVVAYEVVHGSYGNRLEIYLDPEMDNKLWGLRWFSDLVGVAGNQSMIFHEETLPESIPARIFLPEANTAADCSPLHPHMRTRFHL